MSNALKLPIDDLLPELREALCTGRNVVVEAAPGSGKTTRVPWFIHQQKLNSDGAIVVLEPRRLAARLPCEFIARQMGEPVGATVGYHVRFDKKINDETRIRFLTEGLLVRQLVNNPQLEGINVVVFDEFHERHLDTDLALAFLVQLQKTTRPDLRLVVMSATLNSDALQRFLPQSVRLRSDLRSYQVDVEHAEQHSELPLDKQVQRAVQVALQRTDGHILIFLPGRKEIERAMQTCATIVPANHLILPLYGELSSTEQDRAIAPTRERKIIFSTNVAETSITIDGVTAVIDSGLAKVAGYDPWSGLPTLAVQKISQASAVQRAGRAGRTSHGMCIRLYTLYDFNQRSEQTTPEIERADLTETVLWARTLNVPLASDCWLDRPPQAALVRAQKLLELLGAVHADGSVTSMGRKLAAFPVHPRLGRAMHHALETGCVKGVARLVALLSEPSVVMRRDVGLDLLTLAEYYQQAERANFSPALCRDLGLHVGTLRTVAKIVAQLERTFSSAEKSVTDDQLRQAILHGFPDRVGKARLSGGDKKGRMELLLCEGGSAWLPETSSCSEGALAIVLAATTHKHSGGQRVYVEQMLDIHEDWLLDLPNSQIASAEGLVFDDAKQAVLVRGELRYDKLILEHTERPAPQDRAADILFAALQNRGLEAIYDPQEVRDWQQRLNFVARHVPEIADRTLDAAGCDKILRQLCDGCRSVAQLREQALTDVLRQHVGELHWRKIAEFAPTSLRLANGKSLAIHYESDKQPWVESYLQDFFGMPSGPTVAKGRVLLTIHLWAPSRRPLQVTADLLGFWEKHYPTLRRQLSRDYPKHYWPEDPRHARPEQFKRRVKT